MSSGFSSHELLKSLSNYPVAKGDVEGHPFHGNQYTNGIYGEAHTMATDGRRDYVKPQAMRQLADRFRELADRYEAEKPQAAQAHAAVATHLDRIANGQNYPSASQWSRLHALTEVAGGSTEQVAKGDLPGHEFHGNQYVSGGNQAYEARRLADAVKDGSADHFTAEGQHRAIARACEEQAKMAGDAGLKRIANAYTKAANLHRAASAAHTNSLIVMNSKADPVKASEVAAKASEHADELNYA
jgi:hypothetical protein